MAGSLFVVLKKTARREVGCLHLAFLVFLSNIGGQPNMIQVALISINIDEASMADVVVKAAGSKIKQVLIPAVKEQCRALEELLAKKYSHTQSNYCKLALSALHNCMPEGQQVIPDMAEPVNVICIDFEEALSSEESSLFWDTEQFTELLQDFDSDFTFQSMETYPDKTGVRIDLYDTTVETSLILAYSLDEYFQRCGISNHIKKVSFDYV